MKYLKKIYLLALFFSVPLEDPRKNANLHTLKIEEEMRNGKNVEVAKSLGFDKKKIEYVSNPKISNFWEKFCYFA